MGGRYGQTWLASLPVSRTVTLVLVDEVGAPLGVLPPFAVDIPYWPEVAGVVAAARERFGVEVAVLRMLSAERPIPHGGAVTYLAQATGIPDVYAGPVEVDLSDHPHRADYARPGGPTESLRWAALALEVGGRGPVTEAIQQRTWNLSAIWRLETPSASVWLKHVPHFFDHEPTVLRWIAENVAESGEDQRVPRVLGSLGGRMLLDHVVGDDLYDAGPEIRDAIAADMHGIQVVAADHTADLLGAGVPDRRPTNLTADIARVVTEHGGADARLDALVTGIDDRLAKVASCGLPDTLVHGDLHPGNVRSDGRSRTLIDWGDSFIGHPAFDILRLTEELDEPDANHLIDTWAARWRAAAPGCDPYLAVELMRPVAALRNAAVYAHFLDNIEPAEHPYHAADVGFWLTRAAEFA